MHGFQSNQEGKDQDCHTLHFGKAADHLNENEHNEEVKIGDVTREDEEGFYSNFSPNSNNNQNCKLLFNNNYEQGIKFSAGSFNSRSSDIFLVGQEERKSDIFGQRKSD